MHVVLDRRVGLGLGTSAPCVKCVTSSPSYYSPLAPRRPAVDLNWKNISTPELVVDAYNETFFNLSMRLLRTCCGMVADHWKGGGACFPPFLNYYFLFFL